MTKYLFRLMLKSDAFISSGDGHGTLIDGDNVYDEIGLPYIPAKRLKGCLKDGYTERLKNFAAAGLPLSWPDIFGSSGAVSSDSIEWSNMRIQDYHENKAYLKSLLEKNLIRREELIEQMTFLRQVTAIDEQGIAKAQSLRTIRVLKQGLIFETNVCLSSEQLFPLVLAINGFEELGLGSGRRRGLGEIQCELYEIQNKAQPQNLVSTEISNLFKKLQSREVI